MTAQAGRHDQGDGGARLLVALTEAERERVLAGNARDWYPLDA